MSGKAAMVLIIAAGVVSSSAHGQTPQGRPCVSEDLPVHHWAEEAVDRLQGLGLTAYHSNDRVLNRCRVEEAFAEAREAAPGDADLLALVDGWQRLLDEERSGASGDSVPALLRLIRADVALGVSGTRGSAAPGFAEFAPDRTGSEPLDDGLRSNTSFTASTQLLKRFYLAGGVTTSGSAVSLDKLELTAPVGPVLLTVGRGYNRFGEAKGGSIVYSGVAPLDRFEISTREGFHLPGLLRRVGEISFTTFLATVNDERHADDPYFWGMRGTLEPHPRFRVSVNRAALFGGDARMRLDNLGMMLLGRVQGKGFEDQIVSLEGWFRLPSEAVVPLTLGLEWGAEDAAGAWTNVPGVVVSLRSPSIPGAEYMSAGFEYTTFGTSCCLNPEWYRHWSFPGSWALGERPMGHPLGGDGSELLLTSTAHLSQATVRLRNDVFARHRGEENLYVPGRQGRSFGLRSGAEWRVRPGLDLTGDFSVEGGEGWRDQSMTLEGKLFF